MTLTDKEQCQSGTLPTTPPSITTLVPHWRLGKPGGAATNGWRTALAGGEAVELPSLAVRSDAPAVQVQPPAVARPTGRPRVVIADAQTLLVEGLARLLEAEPRVEVVGSATSAEALLVLVERLHPDVALIDITLPGRSGIELVRLLGRGEHRTRVILMGTHLFEAHVPEAFEAGAAGFILKEATPSELCRAIQEVHRGRAYLSEATSRRLALFYLDGAPGQRDGRRKRPVSARERELLDLLAAGYSNRQIASLLFISPKTVESHKRNIMAKLGLSSCSELLRYAVLRSLLHGEDAA